MRPRLQQNSSLQSHNTQMGELLRVSCRERLPLSFLLSLIISLFLRLRPGVSGFTVESVKRGVLPFLRCAALFFNCLIGVPPPEELSSTAGHYTSYVGFKRATLLFTLTNLPGYQWVVGLKKTNNDTSCILFRLFLPWYTVQYQVCIHE